METKNKTWSRILSDVYKSDAALKRKGPTNELPPIVNNFIRGELIQQMKVEDDLFMTIYINNVGTGSYYQGLRVHEATEFDIDVELNFYDPVVTHKDPGWVQLNCKSDAKRMPETPVTTKFLALMDSKGIILPDKVVQWFKKVCQQALHSLIHSGGGIVGDLKLVDSRKCGPAVTITVTAKSGERFDVDLVPVYCHARHEYHCVPKKGPKSNLWRITHFSAEKRLLEEPGCAKKVIKLLKLFRDRQGPKWNRMASYYLKTIVMNMISGERRISWRENHIGLRFIGALEILNQYLIMHYIPFYPDSKENLLKKVGKTTVEKMQKDLETILKEIHEHPGSLREVFVLRHDEQPRDEKVMTEGRLEWEAKEKWVKPVSPDEWTPKPKAVASATRDGSSIKSARKSSETGESEAAKVIKARKASEASSTASLVDGIRCDAEKTTAASQNKVTMLKATIIPTTVSGRKKETRAVPTEKVAAETTTTTPKAKQQQQKSDIAATRAISPRSATATIGLPVAATPTKFSSARRRKIPDVPATKAIMQTTKISPRSATATIGLPVAATPTKFSSARRRKIPDVPATKAIMQTTKISPRSATATIGLPVAATPTKFSSARRRKIPDVPATKAIMQTTKISPRSATATIGLPVAATPTKFSSARRRKIPDVPATKAIMQTTKIAKQVSSVDGATSEKTGARKPLSTRQDTVTNVEASKAMLATSTAAATTKTKALSEAVGLIERKPKPVSSRKRKTPNLPTTNATATKGTTTRVPSAETEAMAKTPAPWRTKIYDVAVAERMATATTAATKKH